MKIYTKTGDEGMTGLIGGVRISKGAPRIIAYGEIDELNACLGVIRAETPHILLKNAIGEIQHQLFTIGAQLAAPHTDPKIERITAAHVESLERQIDAMQQTLLPLKHFILPGGSKTAAFLHLARTVCRRAERSMVALSQSPQEPVDVWCLTYINRLSDYLFVMSRLANQLEKIEDIPWIPQKTL
ncbi:MAG: cob(I)yrinic acid a,c-diamide adenosyltransferase [Proteobacteria bacterium]|nr:cob(I)yrinic acid a,c-diamide adenosyltransferase [Pseudomonadota bacterium]NDD04160.1 cob(I)yrinic acid a,c-diamide adenosyltransferase [Pseudomonadota bacterium]NDG26469.1 cob(I)yrinic acid a,c-diamide adenosyltransferase [Pseudomonadota bacterium]